MCKHNDRGALGMCPCNYEGVSTKGAERSGVGFGQVSPHLRFIQDLGF